MHVTVDSVLESNGAKLSVHGGQIGFDRAAHQDFFGNAITNQIRDGDDLQTMHDGKVSQLRQTRHRSIFVHDFADHAGGIEPGNPRHVNGGFRLSGTNQHAALLGAQREDVSGSRQVLRPGARIDGSLNRGRAIGR